MTHAWNLGKDLITYAAAAELGLEKPLLRAHRDGRVERVSRGVYVPRSATARGSAGQQRAADYLRLVLAAARRLHSPVFTSWSAVALLGLPIVGRWPQDIYVLSRTAHGKRRRGLVSVARRSDAPVTTTCGLELTDVEFTLIQLARHAPLVSALVAANAACLTRQGDDGLTTPARLWAEHERLLPYRSHRRVQAVLDRVRDNAESPLETLSDLTIDELGFAAPRHQVRFSVSTGSAYLDFYWEEAGIGGEADGDTKYLMPGSDAGATVLEEKHREDELRAQLHGLVRWNWREAWLRTPLEAKLERAGVPRPRLPRQLR
ncbi:type IV toxin-antitoxin system AbiEi family antitoxin domain-containing protein [Ruania alkalisoli]|uniref:Type IV toxin-antitoxin system AbiEi family antitoxin domain-containing protein n=1 Tax=Ruania alkalisoli TaxID=2779775 RepID=A0A7M1SRX4_9MICO|nr:type IV toxin-antitoxin system AbiEi family antitoxin domain-containing protein [Ruania alkalisoli]QOR69897.1 type IV toxin-antitoxin system AbiEi family antitoxin domain-containing protein [Ruania alkalisoli]